MEQNSATSQTDKSQISKENLSCKKCGKKIEHNKEFCIECLSKIKVQMVGHDGFIIY